jgi:iron(III) transport system permease protein
VYFYTFVSAGLARLDESQLEAAGTLGAPPLRRLLTVTLPLLTPSLVGAALLVFMLSMASFTAPYVLGGVEVLTVRVLVSHQQGQALLMRAETVVLASVCLTFLALLSRLEGRRAYIGGSKGATATRRPVRNGWARLLLGLLGVGLILILLLPHAMLLLLGLSDLAEWTTQLLPPSYSLDNFRYVLTDANGRVAIGNSLRMAGAATAANLLWALPAGYLLVRYRFRGRGVLQALVMLPYAIPGTVIALALAGWFSVDSPATGRWLLLNTFWILPLAYFVRNIPLTVRAVQSSMAQLDPSLEQAAATLGSAPGRAFRTIVLPLVLPGALAGGLLAFISAMGEFVASIVLYTPANRPIAIEIWQQMRAYFELAAAYGVVLIVVVGVVLVATQVLTRRGADELAI